MKNQGYIKIYRKIRDNILWKEKRRFSKLEAWLDILLSANHKDTKILVELNLVEVKKGEIFTSQLKLSQKWSWGVASVNRFIKLLKSENQIRYRAENKYTIISILNWDKYQSNKENMESSFKGNMENKRKAVGKQSESSRKQSIMIKNDNNDKEGGALTPKQTMNLFLKEENYFIKVAQRISQKKNLDYNLVLKELKKFKNYWSEPNGSGNKQRWELQRTFELSRRITTWFSNYKEFNKLNKEPLIL
jgi:hypothetical protein